MLIPIDSDVFLCFLVCILTDQILPSREVKPRACHKLSCESKGAPERLNPKNHQKISEISTKSFPAFPTLFILSPLFPIQNQQNVMHYWKSPQLANAKIKLLSKYWGGLHDTVCPSCDGSYAACLAQKLTHTEVTNRVECSSQQLCAWALESELTRFQGSVQDFQGDTLGTSRPWVAALRVYSSWQNLKNKNGNSNLQI